GLQRLPSVKNGWWLKIRTHLGQPSRRAVELIEQRLTATLGETIARQSHHFTQCPQSATPQYAEGFGFAIENGERQGCERFGQRRQGRDEARTLRSRKPPCRARGRCAGEGGVITHGFQIGTHAADQSWQAAVELQAARHFE